MAYGDIVIKTELRPCIVETPEEREIVRTNSYNEERQDFFVRTVKEAEKHNALFHAWSPGTEKSGIVEYEDGTVHMVNPEWIRFIDRKTEEYCFETENR